MRSTHGIWDEQKEEVQESRRVCEEDERSIWGSRGSTEEESRRNEEICR